jgi:hypothetical protein
MTKSREMDFREFVREITKFALQPTQSNCLDLATHIATIARLSNKRNWLLVETVPATASRPCPGYA